MYPPSATEPAAQDSPFVAVAAPLRAALQKRGFTALTPVQEAVLDSLAATGDGGGRDLQITSQTGSGKTVALGFALAPALLAVAEGRVGPTTLVIAPTRELAAQICDELQWLFAEAPHVTFDCVTGGTSQHHERQRLKRPPTVLVGTPGRLLDHVTTGAVALGSVGQLVLDEADQMLDLGFRDELEAILAQVPKQRRTHLVSATFPAAVRGLTKRYQHDPLHIEGTALGSAHADIEHIAHLLNARDRYGALVNHLLLAGDARVLVFVRTREDTTSLADKLETDGFRAMPISGDLTQGQRTRTLAAFRRGTITTLVATDVAARGLDIENVQSVVHMEPPIDSESYTHRSGRTGRAGQKGSSVLLVPRTMERRAARLLTEARVQVQWRPVPSAAQVRAARDERLFERLRMDLAGGAPPAGAMAIAQRLLALHEPATVVAALLAQAGGGPVCEAFDFGAPAVRGAPAREPAAPRGHAPAAPVRDAAVTASPAPTVRPARPEAPSPSDRPVPRQAEPGFVLFRINWGTANGADARRILAHLCRRGDIHSRMVGAIDLRQFDSTFGIDAAVAGAFAQRVARRDARDPGLFIHRVDADAPRRSPRRPARTPQIWSRRPREQGAP